MVSTISTKKYRELCEVFIQDILLDEQLADTIPESLNRFEDSIRYYMDVDQNIRGILIASAYLSLCKQTPTEKEIHQAYLLGWCWEILIIYGLMLDDHIDNDENRWGKPTWNQLNNRKKCVIIDSIIIKEAGYRLLHKYFCGHRLYHSILALYSNTIFEFLLGCSFEQNTIIHDESDEEKVTLENYKKLTKFVLRIAFLAPFQLAMTLAEIPKTGEIWTRVCKIGEEMSVFFQIQDDLADSFVKNLKTLAEDTDIKGKKLTWFLCKAKSMANKKQWKNIMDSLGKDDQEQVAIVKGIYEDLGLPDKCKKYLEGLTEKIKRDCMSLVADGHKIGNTLCKMLDNCMKSDEYSAFI